MPDPRRPPYTVFLLFEEAPTLDKAALTERLRARVGAMEPLGDTGDILGFVALELADANTHVPIPPQVLIAPIDQAPDEEQMLQPLRQQTWDWPGAADPLGATAMVSVTTLMASGLSPTELLGLVQGTVLAIMDLAEPVALAWRPAQRLIHPAAFREAMEDDDDPTAPIAIAVNVRLFNIGDGQPDETIMDTRGLEALGANDLQFHFAGYDPGPVASWLFGLAAYVAAHPDAIASGHTVDSFVAGEKWICHFEEAIVGPEREVIDIDCGPGHNAREAAEPTMESAQPGTPWWQFWN